MKKSTYSEVRQRLRKKRRLGEFQDPCFEVGFSLPATWTAAEHDAFWDTFIGQAIETHGILFGGGCGQHWSGVVAGGRHTRVGEEHRAALQRWLAGHSAVAEVTIGPLVDAWHRRPVRPTAAVTPVDAS